MQGMEAVRVHQLPHALPCCCRPVCMRTLRALAPPRLVWRPVFCSGSATVNSDGNSQIVMGAGGGDMRALQRNNYAQPQQKGGSRGGLPSLLMPGPACPCQWEAQERHWISYQNLRRPPLPQRLRPQLQTWGRARPSRMSPR